jgi:hypothetical protein
VQADEDTHDAKLKQLVEHEVTRPPHVLHVEGCAWALETGGFYQLQAGSQ